MSPAQKENIFEKQKSFKTIEAKHAPRHLQIAIAENLGINTSGMLPSDEKIKSDETAGVKKEINLSEQLAIVSNDFDTQSSVLVKGVHDVQATIDRIWNSDRIRLIGKTVVVDNPLTINQPVTKLSSFDEKLSYNNYYLERDFVNIFNKLLSVKLTKGVSLDTNNEASFLIGSVHSTEDNILLVAHDFVSAKNPIIFVLLVPLSGYILIRAEEARFQFQKSKQFLSFCFIALLLSSMVLTPISISSSYSNKAYAEIDNNTGLLSKTASNSSINSNYTDIPVNFTVQSPIGNFSNINSSTIASLNPLPSTIMKVTPSDQISIDDVVTTNHASNVTNPVSKSAFDNSTFSENAVISDAVTVATSYHTSNATLSLSEEINITDTETTPYHTPNPTTSLAEDMVITDIVSAVQHSTIPKATQSRQFGSTNETKNVGDIQLQKEPNGTSLKLDGSGYLTQNVNSTRNLSALTLSAWIKPDYSQGSPQFTVLSKENTFVFAVNNIIPPTKIAVFSVFDGIKWQTVESNTAIPEEWTHLVATFTGSSIAIYVNGNLESTIKTSGVLTVAVNGKLATKTVDSLSSDADIVIGGYYNSLRATSSNKFSGLIKDVKLYDSLLSPSQIQRIYEQNNIGTNTTESNSTGIYNNSTLSEQVSMIDALNLKLKSPVSNLTGVYHSTLTEQVSMIDALNLKLSSHISNSSEVYMGSTHAEQVSLLDTLNLSVNSTSVNDTSIPIIPALNKTKNAYLITENPEFQFQYFTEKDLKHIFKEIKASYKSEQRDQWKDKKQTISVQITGPDAQTIPLKSVFKEIRLGKFDIKLSSVRDAKPGIYKIKVTMIKDGKTFVIQDQYQWGLVSLNTQKSIYKPGEVANFVIVVLDNGGHSVCNATIAMNIHDPSSGMTTLYSGNGIAPDSHCGLYNAQYTTKSEGNYTIDLTAQNPSGTASFSTSFLVQNSYPFDVIRTADSKIDPVDNPNLFNVTVDIGSYVNATSVTIQESVPSVFNVTTNANVKTVGDTKILTWNKDLIGNKTSIKYSYSVPLEFPRLYALGPMQIAYEKNQTFTEARPWFVANDPANSQFVQGTGITVKTAATTIAKFTSNLKTTDDKLIIGILHWNIGTGGNNYIPANNLRLKINNKTISSNNFALDIGTPVQRNTQTFVLIGNDTTQVANPVYNFSATTYYATNSVATGQIVVISNSTGSFKTTNQTSTPTLTTGTTIYSKATTFSGANLVIAEVELKQTAASTTGKIAKGGLVLSSSSGASTSNQHPIYFETNDANIGIGNSYSELLILDDPGAGSNPTYTVKGTNPASGTSTITAAVKMVILNQNSNYHKVVTGTTDISIKNSDTKLGIITPAFTSGDNVVIGTMDINQTSASYTSINAGNAKLKNTTDTTLASSPYKITYERYVAGTNVNDTQLQIPFVYEERNAVANPKYNFSAAATTGAQLQGVLRGVVIHIKDNFANQTETATISDAVSTVYLSASTVSLDRVWTNSTGVSSSPYRITLNVNIYGGTNRALIVGIQSNDKGSSTLEYDYGTENLTDYLKVGNSGKKLYQFNGNNAELWYLNSTIATPGSHKIVVTMRGSTAVIVGAYSLYGVDQKNPIPTTAKNFLGATPPQPTVSITTKYGNS